MIMFEIRETGWIELITGSMYCGKSEELIRRIRRAHIAKQRVKVFKPMLDERYKKESIVSHSGASCEAIPVDDPEDILKRVEDEVNVVAIDEVQFFEEGIAHVCETLADEKKRVICAGLDRDFRGEPFGPIKDLLALAEYVDKLQAICVKCGNPATRTQRLINGEPASYSDPIILLGAYEVYEARCRRCHEVARKKRDGT